MTIDIRQKWSTEATERGSAWTAKLCYNVAYFGPDIGSDNKDDAINRVKTSKGWTYNSVYTTGITDGGTGLTVSAYMYVNNISSVNAGGPCVYDVTYSFSTTPNNRFPIPANPTAEPIEYEWSFGNTSEPIDVDIDGNPIANTNFDVFQALPNKNFGLVYVTIRKNFIATSTDWFDIGYTGGYTNHVNSVDWNFGPGGIYTAYAGMAYCKYIKPMTPLQAQTGMTGAAAWMRIEYNFEFKPPYKLDAADAVDGLWDSYKYRVANTGKKTPYKLTSGSGTMYKLGNITLLSHRPLEKVNEDVRLKEDGTPMDLVSYGVLGYDSDGGLGTTDPMSSGVPLPFGTTSGTGKTVQIDTDTNCVFLKYNIYPKSNFNTLGL